MYKKSALMLLSTVGALALSLTSMPQGMAAILNGSWRPYGNTNPITSSKSSWKCGSSQTVITKVIAQVCIVVTADGKANQGAIIVRNNRSSPYKATATVNVYNGYSSSYIGSWYCQPSWVGANSWSVCFGSTFTHVHPAESSGYINNLWLGFSGLL